MLIIFLLILFKSIAIINDLNFFVFSPMLSTFDASRYAETVY